MRRLTFAGDEFTRKIDCAAFVFFVKPFDVMTFCADSTQNHYEFYYVAIERHLLRFCYQLLAGNNIIAVSVSFFV